MVNSFYDIPFYRPDGYFHFNPDDYYKQVQQIQTLTELLGSEELANDYIQENEIYLSRGHMAANSDFVYYSYQVGYIVMSPLSQEC